MAMNLSITGLVRPGLSAVSVAATAGECIALRGASGSGKSLFLRAVADLDPNEGEVVLGEMNRAQTAAPDWRRAVAYLHPESGWWADTVSPHFGNWAAALELIEGFGLSPDIGGWAVSRLSTGEKQRLALVRLLCADPRLLLLDEPTSALDGQSIAAVERELSARLAGGAIILMATHDAAQAERLGARILEFEAGVAKEEA